MSISVECRRIAKLLEAQKQMLVLAESCTAGLVAASLGKIPGISRFLCGSLATYRDAAKTAWLRIPPATLAEHGAVSDTIARAMAEGALAVTPEANLSASITGHLGPGAPNGFDGLIFIGLAQRNMDRISVEVTRLQLESDSREIRQREAAELVLRVVRQKLSEG